MRRWAALVAVAGMAIWMVVSRPRPVPQPSPVVGVAGPVALPPRPPGPRPPAPRRGRSGCATSDPNCVPAGLAGVDALILRGDSREAESLLRRLLEQSPNNVAVLRELGRVQRDFLGDLEAAEKSYQAALAANPDRIDIHNDLNDLAARTGGYDRPRRFLAELDTKHPDNAHVKLALGELELIAGRPDQAVAALESASRLMPDLLQAQDALAEAYLRTGRRDQAVTTLTRVLEFHLERRKEVITLGYSTEGIDHDIERAQARLMSVDRLSGQ